MESNSTIFNNYGINSYIMNTKYANTIISRNYDEGHSVKEIAWMFSLSEKEVMEFLNRVWTLETLGQDIGE